MDRLSTTTCVSLLLTCLVANSAHAQRQLVGNLMCTAEKIEDGEVARDIDCRLRSLEGPPARYAGSIRRLSDVPKPNEQLVFNWSVLSNAGNAELSAIEGRYVQQPAADRSGSPTNLVGGKARSIVLQPLDDFGGAFAVLELELKATKV